MSEKLKRHVGELIKRDFIDPNNLKIASLSREIGISRQLLDGIINQRFRLTMDVAVRLAIVFETSPNFWLNYQNEYEVAKLMSENNFSITPRFWDKPKKS